MPLAPIPAEGDSPSAWRRAREALLAGNDLPARWRARSAFTVCEIGFGDGSGFLDLWRIWRDDPGRPARLHILAIEPHPGAAGQCVRDARALDADSFRCTLAARWPPLLAGVHRLEFEGGQITLTLVFAPVALALNRQTARVDAYFLNAGSTGALAMGRQDAEGPIGGVSFGNDGALGNDDSLGANEPRGARDLARGLVRLAAPQATVVVGANGLALAQALHDAGFVAANTPAPAGMFAMRLRDRTSNRRRDVFGMPGGQYGADSDRGGDGDGDDNDDGDRAAQAGAANEVGAFEGASAAAQWAWDGADRHAIVVGAGLAGAGVAAALAHRNWRVTVIAADAVGALDGAAPSRPSAPAATHRAAALTPMISRDDDFRARLTRAGSQRALARWEDPIAQGVVRRCATVEVAADAQLAADWTETLRQQGFPQSWVRAVDAREATELAGLPLSGAGVYFADGLLVRPVELIAGLLRHPAIVQLAGHAAILRRTGYQWRILSTDGRTLAAASTVVLANSLGTVALLRDSGLLHGLPKLAAAHALAGEITCLPAGLLGGGPRCIVGGVGYLLPAVGGKCVIGSTYVHGAARSEVTAAGQRGNLDKAASLLAGGQARLGGLTAGELPGWAGWRAVLPGRLPAAGPLVHAPGIWIATGYASRGLTWSPLIGDLIGAALDGEPFPIENDLIRAIRPR